VLVFRFSNDYTLMLWELRCKSTGINFIILGTEQSLHEAATTRIRPGLSTVFVERNSDASESGVECTSSRAYMDLCQTRRS